MSIYFSRRFRKQSEKLPRRVKARAKERIHILSINEYDPVLNNHALAGAYMGCRSINVTGDYRIIYRKDQTELLLVAIGTHAKLYE